MMIHIEEVINAFAIIILFVILNFFLKFYTVFFLYHSQEYNKEQAIRSSAIMLSLSEFSLVLLIDATNKGLIASEILSAFGIAFIISAFLSSMALKPKIFKRMHILIPKTSFFDKFALRVYKTKRDIEEEITKKVYAEGKYLWKDAILILAIFAVFYILSDLGHFEEGIILLFLSLPFTIHSLIKIAKMTKEIINVIHSFLVISKVTQKRIIGNILMLIVIYFIFTTNFSVLSFLHNGFMLPALSVFFGIIMLFFIYDTIYVIATEKIINLKDVDDYIEKITGIKKI